MPATSITPFVFDEHMVRVHVDAQGELWFVAKDVCKVLDLSNVTEATRSLDDDERCSEILNTSGGTQEMLLISESGMYALVFRSRKSEARIFSKWVRAEVLPSVRRRGSYTLHRKDEAPSCIVEPVMPVDMVSQLPEDVLCLPARVRDRAMHYALQMTRIMGGAGRDYILSVFVQCCRIIGSAGNDRQRGHGLPFENEDSRTFTLVQDFVQEMCAPCPSSRLRCMKLYGAFAHWCEKRRQMDAPQLPSVIRFSRALERIPSVKKVSNNPYAVFAGLRFA